MTVSVGKRPRGSSTICLPLLQEDHDKFINDPDAFRAAVDRAFSECPELFPKAFAQGYTLKDSYTSKKTGLCQRRIQCKATGESFQIRPCFILPYMTGQTKDVEKALFLRKFGVPFHALAYVFGKDPMYWYRLEVSLGRNSIVGTTLRQAALPEHLLADAHAGQLHLLEIRIDPDFRERADRHQALPRLDVVAGVDAAAGYHTVNFARDIAVAEV